MSSLRVDLERIGQAAFRAVAGSGGTVIVDGSPEIGGEGRGMRPMELLLTALSTCAAMDVVLILTKQREPLTKLEIETHGDRKSKVAGPTPFERIHVRFIAHGKVNAHKLERAVRLSVEKYCSVSASLSPDVTVTHEAVLAPEAPEPT